MYIYIRGMSEYQSKIYDKLTDAADKIVEHIVKLALFPNCIEEANHWKREIFSFLWKIDKLKGKNKYPSEKFIYNALSVHTDNIEVYMDVISNDFKEAPSSVSVKSMTDCVDSYMHWAAHTLSATGRLQSSEIYAKLDELLTAVHGN